MDVILGMGEVGSTMFELLDARGYQCVGVDTDASKSRNVESGVSDIVMLHVCIPGDMEGFVETVLDATAQYGPRYIMVHSTVRPGTAAVLRDKVSVPVLSSPARGVHRWFLYDMRRYTKFVASDDTIPDELRAEVQGRFKKIRWMSATKTLEYAKILVDTTYYGWLINYAQVTKMICDQEGMDYDEMWALAEEAQQFLGNRPKMHPGVIGGHCVIPNLSLIDNKHIQMVDRINETFRDHVNKQS